MLFPFLKIGFTRAVFSLSGKTPFAKKLLKICFRINISSVNLLTTSADISSYPKLLFSLRLANAFSSSKSVRLMVLSLYTAIYAHIRVRGRPIRGAYIREEKHFELQSVKVITLLFFFLFSRFCNNQEPQMVRITFIRQRSNKDKLQWRFQNSQKHVRCRSSHQ